MTTFEHTAAQGGFSGVEHALCATVLGEPNIYDCAVVPRHTLEADQELILYFVRTGPIEQAALRRRLEPLLPPGSRTLHLVPLFKLPLTADGSLDLRTLEQIPVLDSRLVGDCERALRKRSGIRNAAVVRTRRQPPGPPLYHLTDLWPQEPPGTGLGDPAPAAPPFDHLPDEKPEPAMVSGGALASDDAVLEMTLPDILHRSAHAHGDRTIRFVSAEGQVVEWDYRDLAVRAERLHAGLSALGLAPGEKVIFQLRGNQDILPAFWACQMGGFIPIIVEVPLSYESGGQAVERLNGLLQLLDYPLILADDSVISFLQDMGPATFSHALRTSCIDDLRTFEPKPRDHRPQPDDIALFILSSGSTGVPKCIMLSHRNLVTRAYGTNQLCPYSADDVILNWLPLDHVGSISDWHIRCVLLGCELTYADKDFVLRNPVQWLNLIDRFRVSHSWAPNFAFSLICAQLDKCDAPAWDLSCVQGLLTAGEAVSDGSMLGFIRALGEFGLRSTAIWPAFGMAELGSGITYFVPDADRPLRFHTARKPSMGSRIDRVAKEDPAAVTFADLGPPIPGVSLRIIDDQGNPLPIDTVGRVQVRGDVVFRGYFANPVANASALQADGWFNTGDLGFLSQGSLVLTGREKETIIIHGANFYSHELEETTAQIRGVAPSFVAACAVRCSRDNEEKLAIFFVPDGAESESRLIRTIRSQIASRYGVSPAFLIPLEKHEIPKTAIGKIQRNQLRRQFEAGAFDAIVRRVDLLLGNSNTLPSWFYQATWVARQPVTWTRYPITGAVMLLTGTSGLGDAVSERLRSLGQACVTVTPGVGLQRRGRDRFAIDPHDESAFPELLRMLRSEGIVIGEIVSLVDYRQDPNAAGAGDPSQGNIGWFLRLVQAMLDGGSADTPGRIAWVANDCHCIEPGDLGSPEKAMMEALLRTLHIEHPAVACLHLDLPWFNSESNAELLVSELGTLSKEPTVAYRKGRRYVKRLRPLNLVEERLPPVELTHGGCYLVTGGLGGLGFELCRWLGREYQARLLVIGRSPLGDEQVSGTLSGQIGRDTRARCATLRGEAADFMYASADVGCADAVRALVERAEAGWHRPLDGIFHLAGIAHERPLEQESVEAFRQAARPKVQGINVLGALLEGRREAFLIAFSSVSATFGGSGVGGYSAANAYMEARCRQLFRSGLRVFFHAWSSWHGLGMSKDSAHESAAAAKGFRPIPLEDGIHSLLAALHAGQPESIIGLDPSRRPVQTLIADNDCAQQSLRGYVELQHDESAAPLPSTVTVRDRFGALLEYPIESIASLPLTRDGGVDEKRLLSLVHRDGASAESTRDPTDTEARLIDIWRDLLHITAVGPKDNFFDLGGDSLLAVQLVGAIEREFGRQLAVGTVFHAPTIENLAEALNEDGATSQLLSVVPIKATGSQAPLFIVQSSTWDLVRHIDPEQPVFGLMYGVGAKTTEPMRNLPPTLEDLAASYVREVRALQPGGPYFVIGHSAAGLVAYEMARQLSALGEEVALLGLIDTHIPRGQSRALPTKLRDALATFIRVPIRRVVALSRRSLYHRFKKLKTGLSKSADEIPFTLRAKHLYDAYTPLPYRGEVSYWKCVQQVSLQEIRNDELEWKELAGGDLRLHLLDCRHDQIMKSPHVETLAGQIMAYTRKSHATAAGAVRVADNADRDRPSG